MKKVAIIGAGASGLSLAHLLKDYANVTVFEKARGVGGRMSTRQAEPYCFDHGAQYFTARTKAFQEFLQPIISQGIIERWNARYALFEDKKIIDQTNWSDEEPRYVGVPGMNAFLKYLAQDLTVFVNSRVTHIKKHHMWHVLDENDTEYGEFDWLILTMPAPQAALLLPENIAFKSDLKAIKMRACYSLMLGLTQELPLTFDAAHVLNANLSWIAVNSHKPGRSKAYTLVVHSSQDFAESCVGEDLGAVTQQMMDETSHLIGHDISDADHISIHLWRYALNAHSDTQSIFLDQHQKIAACGDWCVGGRVEGAFTSANDLFNGMKGIL